MLYVLAGLFTLSGAVGGMSFAYLLNKIRAQTIVLASIGLQVSPLWARVQAKVAADLHHPHPRYAEMDVFLEKLESHPMTISQEERTRLKELLHERSLDMHEDITLKQRQEAQLMSIVMDLVEIEAIAPGGPEKKQVGDGEKMAS